MAVTRQNTYSDNTETASTGSQSLSQQHAPVVSLDTVRRMIATARLGVSDPLFISMPRFEMVAMPAAEVFLALQDYEGLHIKRSDDNNVSEQAFSARKDTGEYVASQLQRVSNVYSEWAVNATATKALTNAFHTGDWQPLTKILVACAAKIEEFRLKDEAVRIDDAKETLKRAGITSIAEPECRAAHPRGVLWCSLVPGHAGPHRTKTPDGMVFATWEDQPQVKGNGESPFRKPTAKKRGRPRKNR